MWFYCSGIGDLTFQLDAYVYGLLSAVAQSVYLLLVQKYAKEDNLSVLDISYIVSVNAFPLCLSAIFMFDESTKLLDYHGLLMSGFAVNFFLVTISGTLLVYSQFLCTAVTSALTTSLGATIKSVLTTLIGLFVFGGVHVTPLGALGIVLNTAGGVLYTMFKCLEAKNKERIPKSSQISQQSSA